MTPSPEKERLLVVDDSPHTLEVLQRNLTSEGYQVFAAGGVGEAIRILETTKVDLVITDLKMPKVSGIDLVRHVRENCKDTEVMTITGYPSIEGAVKAIKTGAEEYLTKPFTDVELLSAVRRTLDKLHLRRIGQTRLQKMPSVPYGIIGQSAVVRRVLSAVAKTASTSATVLISGESGTGKELVARAIHYSSARASSTFVPVNCGGIPEGLLESELFGHVKGAFTGATESRAGFFQTADGGTIFLDEISDTSLSMQTKLLRVLEDKEVYMVGASRSRKVDIRIIAATNKDLASLVRKGVFREDLFFRLNVLTVAMPPLRERGDDILLLAHNFAAKFAEEFGKATPRFSDNALQVLRNYHWPGNVRELENVVQRLVVMTDGSLIEVSDLPSLMRFSPLRETGLHRTLAEVEAEYIRNVLASVRGNKTKAAEILQIDRKTLRDKLKKTDGTSSL
ncbi:MAG: sigma-54-dependent Fis family transcriptional regulator [Candidatus Zixiibacteriota bacterium]|nr:MAG: sigma-54-dependent Fis family transcriptional regulator [candidate division Zixibacteria bacterium]